jgi:hypothetical protein
MRNDESSGAAQACLTAVVAGNYAEARRLRLQVLADALEDLQYLECGRPDCECNCPQHVRDRVDLALAVMTVPIPDEP